MALTWILEDDPARPDPCDEVDLLLTRFGLATFFYATGGDGWDRNDGWLVEADACDWGWDLDGEPGGPRGGVICEDGEITALILGEFPLYLSSVSPSFEGARICICVPAVSLFVVVIIKF